MKFFQTIAALALLVPALAFGAGNTELTWYGHAAFKLKTPSGKVILIDPWITNPANKNGKEDLANLDKADLILITHGHFDHVGDAVEIAKKTGARLVAGFDLGQALVRYGGFPKDQYGWDTGGNFGGEISLLGGEVKVAFIPAVHSSTLAAPDGTSDIHGGGQPGGFLLSIQDGPSFYHTGDTDVFQDMALIPLYRKVDVMLATIGGRFTMGPERAAQAVKLVKPAMVIPMHYGTFPLLDGTPQALEKEMARLKVKTRVNVLQAGEALKFKAQSHPGSIP